MHELSVAMSIVELAEEEVQRRGGVQVHAIHLKLGPLSGVVKDALLFSFDLARENTSLASSRLIIEEIPIVVYCPRCQEQRTLSSPQRFVCPECSAPTPDLVHGRELEVVALEIQE